MQTPIECQGFLYIKQELPHEATYIDNSRPNLADENMCLLVNIIYEERTSRFSLFKKLALQPSFAGHHEARNLLHESALFHPLNKNALQ